MQTVREALRAWQQGPGKDGCAYDAPILKIFFHPKLPPLRTVNNRVTLQWHDLHHVVFNTGFTFSGEVEVAAWEWMLGSPTWAVWRLDMMGVVPGLLVPWTTWLTLRTMWKARLGRSLYYIQTDYEEVLDWPLERLVAYVRGGHVIV